MFLAQDPTLAQSLQPDDWILDSGCSHSIVCNKNNFSFYISTPSHKISGIGNTFSSGHGNIPLSFALGSSTHACVLHNVLHCSLALFNLISDSQLTDAGYTAIFKDDKVELHSQKGMLLAVSNKISRLYQLCLAGFTDHVLIAHTWDEQHYVFGHLNMKSLCHLKTHNMVNGLEVHNKNTDLHQYKAYLVGKSYVQPFPCESQCKYTEIGEMTYTDLFGKVDQKGPCDEHYFISFTNAAKAHNHVNFLKTKEANIILDTIKKYVAFIFTQTGKKVKCFHFDGGKEYINQEVLDWLELQGINYEITAPKSLAQNSVAECLNYTVMECTCSMLASVSLSLFLWPEVVQYVFYLKNICPTHVLHDNITPYKAFWNRKPNVSNVEEFGTKVCVLIQNKHINKLQPKAKQYIFVGLGEYSHAYQYYNWETQQILTSQNIIFEKLQIRANRSFQFNQVPPPDISLPPLLEEEKEYISCPNKLQVDPEMLPTLFTPQVPFSIPTTPPSSLTPLLLTHQSTPQSLPLPPPKASHNISSAIDLDNIILGLCIQKYAKLDNAHLATANFGLTFVLASYEANQLDGDPKNLVQACAAPDSAQFEAAMDAEKE